MSKSLKEIKNIPGKDLALTSSKGIEISSKSNISIQGGDGKLLLVKRRAVFEDGLYTNALDTKSLVAEKLRTDSIKTESALTIDAEKIFIQAPSQFSQCVTSDVGFVGEEQFIKCYKHRGGDFSMSNKSLVLFQNESEMEITIKPNDGKLYQVVVFKNMTSKKSATIFKHFNDTIDGELTKNIEIGPWCCIKLYKIGEKKYITII